MRKYTRSEKVEVLSPEQHKSVEDELHRTGKTSATQLSPEEMESLQIAIESSDSSC